MHPVLVCQGKEVPVFAEGIKISKSKAGLGKPLSAFGDLSFFQPLLKGIAAVVVLKDNGKEFGPYLVPDLRYGPGDGIDLEPAAQGILIVKSYASDLGHSCPLIAGQTIPTALQFPFFVTGSALPKAQGRPIW